MTKATATAIKLPSMTSATLWTLTSNPIFLDSRSKLEATTRAAVVGAIRQYLGTVNTYDETRTVAPKASGSATYLGPATSTKTSPMTPPMQVFAMRAWKLTRAACSCGSVHAIIELMAQTGLVSAR